MTKILCIGEHNLNQFTSEYEVVNVSAISEDFIFDCHYSAIIISVSQESVFLQWLNNIRSNSLNFASLVYTVNSHFENFAMVDGLIPSNIDIHINKLLQRQEEIRLDSNDNLENKLLAYLWSVETRTLRPSRVIDQGVSYKYPFLELWDNGQGKEYWLSRMVKGGNLSQEALIDRIRQCSSCNSSLLNYVDSCGDCGSIDLKLEQALHCFSCGHVGDQKEFIRSGEMVCPNCVNTLRHIGTDYDRPIENQRCNSCSNLFIEANVQAQCFSCGHNNQIDDLISKEYFSFGIGHNGIVKIKTGADPQLLATNLGEPVSREHFSWMANWLNKMAVRQSEHHLFVGLKFVNLIELSQSMSTVSLTAQLDAFSSRLRSILRTTDVFCQYSDDTLYFLLPNVSEDGVKIIEGKFETISEEQADNPLDLRVSLKLLPESSLSNDAELWLSECSLELND